MCNLVVLDVIEPGKPEPDCCLHGRVACVGSCGEWLWLGDKTLQVVQSGHALPICQPCACQMIPPDRRTPTTRIHDNRRTDGHHD